MQLQNMYKMCQVTCEMVAGSRSAFIGSHLISILLLGGLRLLLIRSLQQVKVYTWMKRNDPPLPSRPTPATSCPFSWRYLRSYRQGSQLWPPLFSHLKQKMERPQKPEDKPMKMKYAESGRLGALGSFLPIFKKQELCNHKSNISHLFTWNIPETPIIWSDKIGAVGEIASLELVQYIVNWTILFVRIIDCWKWLYLMKIHLVQCNGDGLLPLWRI